ncbi:hypothetical protein ANN_09077 [Periplaneta americana]|uniref:Uncharacterized protein n=1 Tax=Periplaneta americana TaxID=6978 RepID=A0ABQ8TKD8_PERAM|nr:hypothetical protein ANN_09077 [Periplaneta americana]
MAGLCEGGNEPPGPLKAIYERCMDTLLHLACKAGSPECVTLLLNRQAEINVKNVDWDTPLHLAAKSSSECVQILLAAGAKPCEMNRFLNKPLHVAVKEGSFQSVKLLVDNISRNLAYNLEAEVNTKNLNKRTPLHFAAQIGSAECVKLLVENKSVLWLKDDVGNVPLHYAAMSKSSECVKLLIKSGANLVSVNKDRNTALSLIVDKMRDGEDLLIKVLDSCIHIDYSNEELKLDLTVLCPVAEDNKMAVANRLYSSHWRKSKLLLHPLLKTLIPLAVRGGDELQSYGLVYHLWGQAQLLYEWNEVKRILRKCKKNSEQSHDYECITIKENQISMSLRHELYAAAKDKEEDNVLTVKEAKEIMKQNMEELLHEIKELRRTIAELQDEDRYET